ncbi:SlyX family protein [Simplicispira suum]|jgi:SlyX protein|uniref:SlyX protein n=1 Tax=Simplicispira suum TaxID=2109915 RepID=A0A2S0N465_9BURK|nr:SlyX family protein [Simplicispira suum]AVO42940.1 SlyX protein [Simplicispira suum]MBW7833246.1 SlyX family protein [Simplicispira suum]MCB1977887.1 SlyX family protein [Burkholderiaceae bacterium]MCO5105230.1 SlyX family protein [Burkholderiaceae bacterium]
MAGIGSDLHTAARLENLEVKLSYMEDLLDELNLVIYRQRDQIDQLAREVVQLRQRSPDGEGSQPRDPRDELPPHY